MLISLRLMHVNALFIAAVRIGEAIPIHNLSQANHCLQTRINHRTPFTRMDLRRPAAAVDCRHRSGIMATAARKRPAFHCNSRHITETILRRMVRVARISRQEAHIRRPGKIAMLLPS
jgi:hypothetical protein